MKGGLTVIAGILIIVIILVLFLLVFICDTPVHEDALYCQPFSPLMEIIGSTSG